MQHAEVAAAAELSAEEADEVRAALSFGADVTPALRAAYEKWRLRAAYDWAAPIDDKFVAAYQPAGARRVYRNLGIALAAPTVDAALAAATAADAMRFSLAMIGRGASGPTGTNSDAAATEARDLLRDRSTYTAFGLTIALWMLRACGFDDFLDPMYVHAVELETRLRGALPALALHAPRAAVEFDSRFGARDIARLRRETDPAQFIACALRCINAVARAAFGAQVCRIPAALGGDAYFVTQNSVGELFALVPAAADAARADRPAVVSLRRANPADPLLPARALFIDRIHYTHNVAVFDVENDVENVESDIENIENDVFEENQ